MIRVGGSQYNIAFHKITITNKLHKSFTKNDVNSKSQFGYHEITIKSQIKFTNEMVNQTGAILARSRRTYSISQLPAVEQFFKTATVALRTISFPLRNCGCRL